MTHTTFRFKLPPSTPAVINDEVAKIRYGLGKPNPRSDSEEAVLTARLRKDLAFEFKWMLEQCQPLFNNIIEGDSTEAMVARFDHVGMHTDMSFDRYAVVLPLCGSGDLHIYGKMEPRASPDVHVASIGRGVGVVFDNHLPHSFTPSTRYPMTAIIVPIIDGTMNSRRWKKFKEDAWKTRKLRV